MLALRQLNSPHRQNIWFFFSPLLSLHEWNLILILNFISVDCGFIEYLFKFHSISTIFIVFEDNPIGRMCSVETDNSLVWQYNDSHKYRLNFFFVNLTLFKFRLREIRWIKMYLIKLKQRYHVFYGCANCKKLYDSFNNDRNITRPCPNCRSSNKPMDEVRNKF